MQEKRKSVQVTALQKQASAPSLTTHPTNLPFKVLNAPPTKKGTPAKLPSPPTKKGAFRRDSSPRTVSPPTSPRREGPRQLKKEVVKEPEFVVYSASVSPRVNDNK